MHKYFTRFRIGLIILFGFIFIASATLLFLTFGRAESEGGYYYNQLNIEAKRFYNAIDDMNNRGDLKTGAAEYDLIANNTVTEALLSAYSSNASLLVAFGAARDAYALDHADVFYVDFSYLSISVGTQNGKLGATLGTGRADNYYLQGGFSDEDGVAEALEEFDAAVSLIVAHAKAAGNSVVDQIKDVNAQLIETTEYSFCSVVDENGETEYLDGAPFIRTAYGALVKHKSVCEGYARAFKTVMDKLEIPCVLVQGYAQGADGGYEPHMWNYVQVDGHWYGVDVTWNDGGGIGTEYLLRGNSVMKSDHIPDGVVSQSGYEFRYPELTPYNYGVTEDENGMIIDGVYETNDSGFTNLVLKLSYNGKSAEQLAEQDGLYFSYRLGYEENGNPTWTVWMYLCEFTGAINREGYTEFQGVNSSVRCVQFSLIDYAPDADPVSGGSNLYTYNPDVLTDNHIKSMSEPYGNAAYGTYTPPPYIKEMTPENNYPLNVNETYTITIVYNEALKKADITQPINIRITAQHSDIENYASISDIVWSEDKPDTISFRFEPSRMFQHRYETYSFYLVNLIGKDSEKVPNIASYMTEQPNVVCNKIFDDGRLYMKVYGEPSLIGAEDLSLKGWKDSEGNFVAENQRSQLMLVVTKPSDKTSADMLDSVANENDLEKGELLACETYELELSICRNIVTIPEHSYMQLAFGFPAGYGPENAGVTFKVYHFKRDENGNIDPSRTEELDCVITEYGLIVTVNDFSPFAVVAVPKSAVDSSAKAIYASTVGTGGTIDNAGIRILSESQSVSYTLLPDDGYSVDRVMLNGQLVTVKGNSVSFIYSELAENNTLEVYYVANRVLQEQESSGFEPVLQALQVVDPMGAVSVSISAPLMKFKKGNVATLQATARIEGATVYGELSYEWYKDGVLIATTQNSSENSSVLSIADVDKDIAGRYNVKVIYTYHYRSKTAESESITLAFSNGKNYTGLILGLVIGVVLLIDAVLAYLLIKRKKGNRSE